MAGAVLEAPGKDGGGVVSEAVYLDPGAAQGNGAGDSLTPGQSGAFRPESPRCCPVCGGVLGSSTGRPREHHKSCGEVVRAISRLLKWLPLVEVRSEDAALRMRRQLIAVANGFPVGWQRPRNAQGRFIKGGGS